MAGVRDWRRRKPREVQVHTRAETVPQSILDRIEALERREIDWQHAFQIVIQTVENQVGRVHGIESALVKLSTIAQERIEQAG